MARLKEPASIRGLSECEGPIRACVLKVGSSFSESLFSLGLGGGVASGKSYVPRDSYYAKSLCGQPGRMSSGMLPS